MEGRYQKAFTKAEKNGRKAFIPFTLLGWPNPQQCLQTIKTMIDTGATALELGIAFSDPVADGPVIQKAAFETLDAGFTVDHALDLVKQVRAYNADIPIGLLVYFNLVLAQGIDAFYKKAATAGVDSVLIADLLPDSADEVVPAATAHGIAPVFIVSPLTSNQRLQKIAAVSTAYIYVVSRLGITGVQEHHDQDLNALLQRARAATKVPLCVGFGISSPAAAREMVNNGADGVITGSKIIDLIRNDQAPNYPTLTSFLRDMNEAVKCQTTVR